MIKIADKKGGDSLDALKSGQVCPINKAAGGGALGSAVITFFI